MAWFTRFTRFGSVHMVRSQDKNMSCGMSSICMVNFKMKKGLMFAGMAAGAALSVMPVPGASYLGQTLAADAFNYAVKSEDEVITLYNKYKGTPNDFNTSGADPMLYPKVLGDLGLGSWERVNVPETAFAQAVIDATADGTPVMAGVTWDGGGGHAVVIDQTFNFFGMRYMAVCDPWDGELRLISITPGSPVAYDGNYQPISSGQIFGGDAHQYDPTVNNKGKFKGGITRMK